MIYLVNDYSYDLWLTEMKSGEKVFGTYKRQIAKCEKNTDNATFAEDENST